MKPNERKKFGIFFKTGLQRLSFIKTILKGVAIKTAKICTRKSKIQRLYLNKIVFDNVKLEDIV